MLQAVELPLFEKILLAVFTLITGLILLHFKNSKEEKVVETKDNNRVKFELERADLVRKLNDNVMFEFDCDRSAIWVIHNGQVIANNIHLYKMSMMWESVKDDIPKVNKIAQNYKIMDFMRFWKKLLSEENGIVHISSQDYPKGEDSEMAKMMRLNAIKSSVNILITDIFGSPIGILSLYYIRKEKKMEDLDIKKFLEVSNKISGILSQKF